MSIVILDCGCQFTHLIRRAVRSGGYDAIIVPAGTSANDLRGAHGIIISGGPASVYEPGSPRVDPGIFSLGVPVLGICYGLQLIAHLLEGEVRRGDTREYGTVSLSHADGHGSILATCPSNFTVLMSHGDVVEKVPPGFCTIASSNNCVNAAIANTQKQIYGLQFHPEVHDTEHGLKIISSFSKLCTGAPSWSPRDSVGDMCESIRQSVGNRNVLMFVSGGVDSTVAFTLLNRALGTERVQGVLIDNGLMRKGEVEYVMNALKRVGIRNLHTYDESDGFLDALQGECDPEAKRKIIGKMFIDIQGPIATELGLFTEGDTLLGMGTLFPDTIESGGSVHADTIKTHHNRVDAVKRLMDKGLVIEPLKELYKDEVREIGTQLGLPRRLVWRHPFPGPGLGVRILCGVEALNVTHVADYPVLPMRSVGSQGSARTYGCCITLFEERLFRPSSTIQLLAKKLPGHLKDVNRVVLCLSHSVRQDFRFTPTSITRDTVALLQEADSIVMDGLTAAGLYNRVWQMPVVLLPCGVSEGNRSIVLRPVTSRDAMTADVPVLPPEFLEDVTAKIMALPGIDAVFLDLTSKPPGTIEWE